MAKQEIFLTFGTEKTTERQQYNVTNGAWETAGNSYDTTMRQRNMSDKQSGLFKQTMTWLTIGLLACLSPLRAQYSLGNTGLMNIPTADMHEPGTFLLGGNYLPDGMTPFNFNTGNYFANISLFSFVELSYRCTLLKTTRYDGKRGYFQQDRSMTARVRPLKEGKYWPALVIGMNDPFRNTGNNYFASVYGVLTKGFSLTGNDRLSLTAGYFYPMNDYSVQDGVFGGVSYSPGFCRELLVSAEYDTQGINVGTAIRLWKHVSVHVFTREFKSVAGGIRYECVLPH